VSHGLKLKFIWRRLILLFILGGIAFGLYTPIHELGHALFATALGGKVTSLYLGPFGGYCSWAGLEGARQNIALAGGIILTLLIGLVLLFAYRRKMFFELRFFSFGLLTALLGSGILYLLRDSLNYLISGLPLYNLGDVMKLIMRGVPAPIFLAVGLFLVWLVLSPLKYIEHLASLCRDAVNYAVKDVRVKIEKR